MWTVKPRLDGLGAQHSAVKYERRVLCAWVSSCTQNHLIILPSRGDYSPGGWSVLFHVWLPAFSFTRPSDKAGDGGH